MNSNICNIFSNILSYLMFNSILNVSIKKLFSAKLCQTEDVFLMLQLLKYTIKQNTKDFLPISPSPVVANVLFRATFCSSSLANSICYFCTNVSHRTTFGRNKENISFHKNISALVDVRMQTRTVPAVSRQAWVWGLEGFLNTEVLSNLPFILFLTPHLQVRSC